MNTLRRILFATIVVISSSTLALGGEMHTPAKSDPPSPPSASETDSPTHGTATPSTEEMQITWEDLATTILRELLTIF